jgi:serine protease Do
VGVTDIDAERTKALKLKEEHGVEVTSVDADSPAAKAGVKVSDVVLEYNGQRVEGIEQFLRLVRETPVGRQVKLLIARNGATQTLTATTGSRPAGNFVWSDDFKFKMPEIHVFPDMPRALMMWQSRTLGVESESLTSQLGEYFGAKEGVLVRSVIKGSAAEKAGLKAGDVITKIGGQKVTSPKDISNALRSVVDQSCRSRLLRSKEQASTSRLKISLRKRSGNDQPAGSIVHGSERRLVRLDRTIRWTLTRSSTSFQNCQGRRNLRRRLTAAVPLSAGSVCSSSAPTAEAEVERANWRPATALSSARPNRLPAQPASCPGEPLQPAESRFTETNRYTQRPARSRSRHKA